jgi:uncharacterized protein YjbI with pentapeptide repeats
MDPTVVAAWIAAGVSVLTLAGTLVAQYLGYRATSRDAENTAEEQRRQLDRTLAEQNQQLDRTHAEQREQLDTTLRARSDQLDRTLAEQSQQLDRTLGEQRTRTLNERFAMAAEQLGSDKPAVRLAGVYAMAGLADDWAENRQTCVDVLCAYLRMPYEPDPGPDAPEPQRLAFQASREVRHTVIRVITAHLRDGAAKSWRGLDFDFTGVVFDGGDFSGAQFTGGRVNFSYAQFAGGKIYFDGAQFSGGEVYLSGQFSSGEVGFSHAQFTGGEVYFCGQFTGGRVNFGHAQFAGAEVYFVGARFSGSTVNFFGARFSGSAVNFFGARFSGGTVDFNQAQFIGGTVKFDGASFSGGTVDFRDTSDWSVPPAFPWTGTPPRGVKLPKEDQSEADGTLTDHLGRCGCCTNTAQSLAWLAEVWAEVVIVIV